MISSQWNSFCENFHNHSDVLGKARLIVCDCNLGKVWNDFFVSCQKAFPCRNEESTQRIKQYYDGTSWAETFLTHISPWEIWMKFWIYNFQTDFSDWCLRHLLWNWPNMNVTGLHWLSVNIGLGNGLVPSGNKPLPEPMLTQISVAIWRH